MFIGIVAVAFTGVYLSRQITKPLIDVVYASEKVAQGNLDIKVEPVGNDEVAVLAAAFNYMIEGLQEATKHRLREIELLMDLEREKELRQLKSQFISMVSHEFRTPLTTILSSSEFLKNYGRISDALVRT